MEGNREKGCACVPIVIGGFLLFLVLLAVAAKVFAPPPDEKTTVAEAISPDGRFLAQAIYFNNSDRTDYWARVVLVDRGEVDELGYNPEKSIPSEYQDVSNLIWQDERTLLIEVDKKYVVFNGESTPLWHGVKIIMRNTK